MRRGKYSRPSQKSSGPWRILRLVAVCVLAVSLITLGFIVYNYWQSRETYRSVLDDGPAIDDVAASNKPLSEIIIDWDALRAKNPDVVGWVYMPETPINYPVVQADDNEKYLSVDFLGGRGTVVNFGSIFSDFRNKADFSDANNIIYGHNMMDGSMFAVLNTLLDEKEFNKHRNFYLFTPRGNYLLESFSVFACEADDPLAQVAFVDEEELQSYVRDKVERSAVEPNPASAVAAAPDEVDKLFALMSCTNSYQDGRVALFASVLESTVIAPVGSNQQEAVDDAIGDLKINDLMMEDSKTDKLPIEANTEESTEDNPEDLSTEGKKEEQ